MRDHNSLDKVMGELYCSFLTDAECITGCDFTLERLHVKRIIGSSGRRGLLDFLEKHHKALLLAFKDSFHPVFADVRLDSEGYPLFLSPLWHRLCYGSDESQTVQAAAVLRQATCLLRKWGEDVVSSGLSVKSFRERMSCKKGLPLDIVDQIGAQLPFVIGDDDLKVDELDWPVITSGARAQRTDILDRLDNLNWIPGAEIFRKDGFVLRGEKPDERVNRLVEVPKDWSKNRLVFAEPSASMNLQQSCRQWLEKRAVRARNRIAFDDQTFQQSSLALPGRASIDLSDASDHIRSSLIWRFLRQYPVLRSALFWGRSHYASSNDGLIALGCFGTMGNATTFTVMSIFLVCLTRLAEELVHDYSHVKHIRASTVFGDDVVCDDYVAGTVLMLMTDCGLVPNQRKTYIGTRFRESCGLDLFNGADITPLYVKHVHIACREDVCRSVDQSNRAYALHLWHTATYLAGLPARSLSVNVDEASLFSYTNASVTTGCAWDADLQRYVSSYKPHPRQRTKGRDSRLDLAYTLFHGYRVRGASQAPRGRR